MWAFDIDGVVSNSYPHMMNYIEKRLKFAFFQMPYDTYNHCHLTKEDFLFVFNTIVINDLFQPMDGAVNVLQRYYLKIKKPIIFISHRNKKLRSFTEKWLDKHVNLPFELYTCLHLDKVDWAKKLNIDGIIEDQPQICEAFIKNGLKALCVKQPWHIHVEPFPSVPVVKDWIEIAEWILD